MDQELLRLLKQAEHRAKQSDVYLECEIGEAAGPLPESVPALAGAMLDAVLDIAQGAGHEKWAYFRLEGENGALTLRCGASGIADDEHAKGMLARIQAAAPGCRVAADEQEDGVQLTVRLGRAGDVRP